jgi:hypothetical protein
MCQQIWQSGSNRSDFWKFRGVFLPKILADSSAIVWAPNTDSRCVRGAFSFVAARFQGSFATFDVEWYTT